MGPSLSQCRPTATTILALQKKVFVTPVLLKTVCKDDGDLEWEHHRVPTITHHCQNPCNLCGKVLSKIVATKRGKLLHESLSSKRCKAIPITFDTVPVVEDVSVENRVSHCKSGQRECCSSFSPLCCLDFSPVYCPSFSPVYCPSFSGQIFMLDSRLCICHQWQPSPEITQCVSKEDTEEKRKERSQVAKSFHVS